MSFVFLMHWVCGNRVEVRYKAGPDPDAPVDPLFSIAKLLAGTSREGTEYSRYISILLLIQNLEALRPNDYNCSSFFGNCWTDFFGGPETVFWGVRE